MIIKRILTSYVVDGFYTDSVVMIQNAIDPADMSVTTSNDDRDFIALVVVTVEG